MKILENSHLCYSLNVYNEINFEDKIKVLEEKIPHLRKLITHDSSMPFALGLWLDNNSAQQLLFNDTLEKFKQFLSSNNYYVFTVNAFPFSVFHNKKIKTDVYYPDWGMQERLNYTLKVSDILAEILPKNITGSISTLPGSYKSWVIEESHKKDIENNICKVGKHLEQIFKKTGKKIILSIEPEPDCYWESSAEFAEFYKTIEDKSFSEFIGICYDTSHQELLETKPGEGLQFLIDNNIPIGKIQLSSALSATSEKAKTRLMNNFPSDIYLHQTRSFSNEGKIISKYIDLPNAFQKDDWLHQWNIHYHIPIYCDKIKEELIAQKDELNAVIKMLNENHNICSNIEIETYTYSILPEDVKKYSKETSIAEEYLWFINKIIDKTMTLKRINV